MKPAAFDYIRPKSWSDALRLIGEGARPGAGTQSLGPLLNLRLAQPGTIADLRHLPDYAGVTQAGDVLRIGAGTTHAAIEDGAVPGRDRRDHGGHRAPHRLSSRAQSGHDRRQPRPCRSRGRLGRRAAGVGRHGHRARSEGRAPPAARRLSSLASSRRRSRRTNCCAPSKCRCCRPPRSGVTGSFAARSASSRRPRPAC